MAYLTVFRKLLQKYVEVKGWKLSDKSEVIIERIVLKNGYCPCRVGNEDSNLCPCEFHEKEIKEQGHCHCNLIVKD